MNSCKFTNPKWVVLLLTCFSAFSTFSQAPLREKLQGQKGLINYITQLDAATQYTFDASHPENNIIFDEHSRLLPLSFETDPLGDVNYRYKQTYNGIPIENSMLLIRTRQGMVVGIIGNIILDFAADMAQRELVSLSNDDAILQAKKSSEATQFAWESPAMESRYRNETGNNNATYYPAPSLVWYNNGEELNPATLRPAYKVDIYAIEPLSRAYYFIDANSGKVLGKNPILCNIDVTGTAATAYSGTVTIHSDNTTGTTHRLRDYSKGNGIITLTAAGADYTNSSANWALTGTNQYALDAHYGVSQTYEYYFTQFGRNSINNAGYALTSYVNESATVDNAYWDGTAMHFGNRSSNGAGLTAIDIDAHELTHGVTQYTSNLTYSNQSGAMNESMSDIFGKTVQFWSKPNDINWTLSNDMGWNIRDMANPNAYGQPDTYLGTNWYTGTADNGGVHTNSGVGNYMYYLLVTGGSGVNDIGNSFVVQGIGLTDAAAIIYRTETVYLVSSSNYSAWRTACINAATDLFGASSNQVSQVMNAWYAVGVGTAAPMGTCSIPSGLSSSAIGDNVATISWTAATGASSYGVQYKASSSSTWSTANVSGTSINLTGLLPGTTYTYQVFSYCSSGGFTAYSAAATFTTTGVAPLIYCTSVGQTLDGIANVTFNTINNTTGLNSYSDYTASIATTVSTGSAYPLTVKINTGGNYTNYTKAWIDWNHDGVFSTTTEEYNLGTAVNVTSGNTSLSPLSITVPANAYIGSTRMRVSTQYNANPAPCTASFDGEVEDYTINVIVGSNCSTPSALTSTGIGNTGATLGWASTGAASYTLQWRLTSSTTWTTVSGITTNSYALTGLTSCTGYTFQVQANCGTTSSTYSATAAFTTAGCAVSYCSSYGTSQSREYIKKVALGTISNTTGANTGGYGNYTTISTNLTGGTSNTITLTPGFVTTSRREYWRVYIDYNKNGTFETSELIGSVNGTGVVTRTFTVPTTALNGTTRMRVQMQYNAYVPTPCTVFTSGEVEDYTINIVGNVQFAQSTEEMVIDTPNATVLVYPNPAQNDLSLQLNAPVNGQVNCAIYSIDGALVKQEVFTVTAGTSTLKMNVTDLTNGIYLFDVIGAGLNDQQRILIAK